MMSEEFFNKRKSQLTEALTKVIGNSSLIVVETLDYVRILNILSQYTYENRLLRKGLIARTIIDSLDIEYSLGEMLIKFDRDIN